MKRSSKTLLASFSILAILSLASQAQADHFHHIDELALDIQKKASLLLKETRHYRHTPNYHHLVNDAAKLRRIAIHVHNVAHVRGSLYHLQSDLQRLDATFHHLEEVFDSTEIDASHGHGHVHGNTRHVKKLLRGIEDCIHHMQEDVAALRRSYHRSRKVDPYCPDRSRGSVYGGSVYGGSVYGGSVYAGPYRGGSHQAGYRGHGYKKRYAKKSHGSVRIGGDRFGFKIDF